MYKFLGCFLTILISIVIAACGNKHAVKPSSGAVDIAGAKGTIVFKPEDWNPESKSWWKDSDGIAPGIAGCHIGTDANGSPNGRTFGEACLSNGLLVESNPGKNEVHGHTDDIGHPDTFDCNQWCQSAGKTSGSCQVMAAPPCEKSAACVCQ